MEAAERLLEAAEESSPKVRKFRSWLLKNSIEKLVQSGTNPFSSSYSQNPYLISSKYEKYCHNSSRLSHICWNINKGLLAQRFQNWGDVYFIEFDILVKKLPSSNWQNVFYFTGTNLKYGEHGERIPALWIYKTGHFHIATSLNGDYNYYTKIEFELGKYYHVIIQQLKINGEYWYEIIVDGYSKFKMKNNNPFSLSTVDLYTSSQSADPFTSDFGTICNVKIGYGGKNYRLQICMMIRSGSKTRPTLKN